MGELTHDANECLGLLPRESRGAKRLLVLLRVHELDFAIVADADARLCRVKIAAPDALPRLHDLGHIRAIRNFATFRSTTRR